MAFAIRGASPDDADFVVQLFELPHVVPFAHGPKTVEDFRRVLDVPDRDALIIERDSEPFGHIVMRAHDGWLAELGVIACKENGTGAGRFAMNYLLHRAFEELRVNRCFLEVISGNTRARKLYESAGFRAEGCYRQGYRADDGTFHDLIPYGILASDYRALLVRPV